jgi:predicted enzyme related to lactoylglutathione lyase
MECDDVEKTYEEYRARGAEFEKPPRKEPWGVMAILKDSEGNKIVLSTAR